MLANHKHSTVNVALRRQRLSTKALAAKVGCKPAALSHKTLGTYVMIDVHTLGSQPPEPLTAVADMVEDEQVRWESKLIKEATRLTQAILDNEKALTLMPEQWENGMTALDRLRRHVNGHEQATEYANEGVGKGNYKKGRPIEKRIEKRIAQSADDARDEKETQLELDEYALKLLMENRVPRYQAKHGILTEVQDIIAEFNTDRLELRQQLEEYRQKREEIIKDAPLVVDPYGEDLSLKVQKPHSFTALNLAEEALQNAKAKRRIDEKDLRKEGRAIEKMLVEQTYDKVLPQLEAGLVPEKPDIPVSALGPSLVSGGSAIGSALLNEVAAAEKAMAAASAGADTATEASAVTKTVETVTATTADAPASTAASEAVSVTTSEAASVTVTESPEADTTATVDGPGEAATATEATEATTTATTAEGNANSGAAPAEKNNIPSEAELKAQAERAAQIRELYAKANQYIDPAVLSKEELDAKNLEKVKAQIALKDLEVKARKAKAPPGSAAESAIPKPYVEFPGFSRPKGWGQPHIDMYNEYIREINGGVPLEEGPTRDFVFKDIMREVTALRRKPPKKKGAD